MLHLWMLCESCTPRNPFRRQEGQGLVEYALIITLVAVLLIAALLAMKDTLITAYAGIGAALTGGS